MRYRSCSNVLLFLSTPSARRATPLKRLTSTTGSYFYPRPPRGGRQVLLSFVPSVFSISIHALREEGDRRAGIFLCVHLVISIHALREEGDA